MAALDLTAVSALRMPRFFEQHGPAYAPLSSQSNDEIFETQEATPTEYPPSRLPGSHSDRSRIRRIQIIGLFVATCILLAALIVRRVAYKGGGGGGWTREGGEQLVLMSTDVSNAVEHFVTHRFLLLVSFQDCAAQH